MDTETDISRPKYDKYKSLQEPTYMINTNYRKTKIEKKILWNKSFWNGRPKLCESAASISSTPQ